MAVKIRLTRLGAKKAPFYRVVVSDSRVARNGQVIESIGTFNPLVSPAEVKIDAERVKYWLSKGAQPTETTKTLLIKQGIIAQPTRKSAPKTDKKKKELKTEDKK